MSEKPPRERLYRLKRMRWYAKPFGYFEFGSEWLASRLKAWAFLEVVEYLGKLSVAVALVVWVTERDDRDTQAKLRAWQVLVEAEGSKTKASGGRIEALQFLNEKRVELTGVDLHEAYLPGIVLTNATLNRSIFNGAVLNDAHLEGAQLKAASLEDAILFGAHLEGAHLNGAQLSGTRDEDVVVKRNPHARADGFVFETSFVLDPAADLTDASLVGADLTDAILSFVTFSGADLRFARLTGANLGLAVLSGTEIAGADLDRADIRGADLSHAIGLSQLQINSTKGDTGTKLPPGIVTPPGWPSGPAFSMPRPGPTSR